jgi:hypothetical protein
MGVREVVYGNFIIGVYYLVVVLQLSGLLRKLHGNGGWWLRWSSFCCC